MELLLRPAVLVPAVALAAFVIHDLFFAGPRLPKLPIVGAREGEWFPFFRAKWRNTLDFKSAVKLADEKYRDEAVLMPLLGSSSMVLLPRSEIQFVTDQPNSVLDMHTQAIETLQTDYTVVDPYLVRNPMHHKLITTTLTNQISHLVPDVADETAWGFDQHWGSGTDYHEVCVYETMRKIVGCVTNRVFVGKPKCPARARAQRLFAVVNPAGQGKRRPLHVEANHLGWPDSPAQLCRHPALPPNPPRTPHKVMSLSTASKQEYVDELRAEIEGVLAEHGGEWNKRALAKMHKLDSVMRESARLNSFVTVGMGRAVVARSGVVTPSGVKIPCGATVVVPSYVVLQDGDVYPNAHEFKPFRFAEQRSDERIEYVERAAKAFASTSTDYLAFGHGRNACPGRFFAANELKLILAHLVLNYDIAIQGSRPPNVWFGLNRAPPFQATVRIRKRTGS
ncbi:cytochrome P450 [Trichocladium antarcticum]|uniref:Cytochrome P450 n=1 Tax=Trichocladium antarcticum TaxID=1450529 RepID=A0AAN6UCY7_9PEZI|nr:cytochrome P450 [Trichocladium antarcticum]